MSMFRKQLKTNHEDWRNFSYSKGDTSLNFKLRIDIKSQLRDFKQLLEMAIEEIDDEINKETTSLPDETGGAGGGGIKK